MKALISIAASILFACLSIPLAHAQAATAQDLPPGLQIPAAARPGPNFTVDRATEAYLNLLSPEQRRRSDAYFEGGYWLQLWGFVYGLGVAALLLWGGISRRMRDFGRRASRRPWLYTWVYAVLFVVAFFILNLPWSIYAGFVREHQYGLATQDFAGWFGDAFKGLVVSAIILPLVLVAIYAAVRRAGARWWVWASGIAF
ncbi:MAG TPA: hypothetical protein VFN13_01245, partial [Rudaea sp.]|nr:hypothetical protein [Rudaea sp.]